MSGQKEKSPVKMLARTAALLAAAFLAAPPASAQTYEETAAPAYAPAQAAYSNAELDQMLAPIALYPDELLSQVLMASTYPLEVVEAARWSRAHPDAQGEDAVSAVDAMDWDPSVKSLVAFPDVLQQMDQNLDWTQRLGEAFLAEQDGVMASVQRLRGAALQQGNLASTDEIVVSREGEGIAIDSPSPDTVYVPYYDPNVVYGTWWWPSYPPVYWAPWPGYYWAGYGFAWTVGIPVGVNFFYGDFDWHGHRVRAYEHHPFYVHDHDHDRDSRDHRWRYDPHHRRDVQFHNPVARQEFAGATSPRAPRTSYNVPRTGDHAPRTGDRAPRTTDRSPRPADRPATQGGASPIARPNATQTAPLAAPAQPRTQPQQGFFPQQRVPQRAEGQPRYEGQGQRARPQGSPQPAHPQGNAPQAARPQYPTQQLQRPPQYVQPQPQHVQPQPQPLGRSNAAPQGVHAMPQFQHPAPQAAQPAPQVRAAPAQPMARPSGPAPAQPAARPSAPSHPAPASAHGDAQGGGDAPRGAGR